MIRSLPHWLWRAVDQEGYIFAHILKTHRNTRSTKSLLTLLLKQQGHHPMRTIAYKLKSYGSDRRNMRFSVQHLSHAGLNNQTEAAFCPCVNARASFRDSARWADVNALSAPYAQSVIAAHASTTTALSRHIRQIKAFTH
ncbi:DDE-type integrase/transposase/recombinase [Asaia sp. BMEF1]|uniref:DDE-type integrase/transposase/recombinase n=1 Tax=Asaia sp. BMEF1 TaxID=3155932 RepID=UPI003F673A65